MRRIISNLALFLTCLSIPLAQAEVKDANQVETRLVILTQDLRCLVCQNQTLAESNATFAKDMRNQIRLMMQQGKTDQEVIDFLVARYGDFILYQPPFKLKTVVLWLGPFIFLALAVSFLYSTISGHQKE